MSARSVEQPSSRSHVIDCDLPKPRMAKAGLPDVTLREKRREHGQVLRRAGEIAGLNRDQLADRFKVDPAQISRWWSGDENPQTWRYEQDPVLKLAYLRAQGETPHPKVKTRFVMEIEE